MSVKEGSHDHGKEVQILEFPVPMRPTSDMNLEVTRHGALIKRLSKNPCGQRNAVPPIIETGLFFKIWEGRDSFPTVLTMFFNSLLIGYANRSASC